MAKETTVTQELEVPVVQKEEIYKGSFLQKLDQEEKELNEEIEQLEAVRRGESVEEDTDDSDSVEPETKEEKTFKKRYGDLRRHMQKKADEHKAELEARASEIAKLKNQIENVPTLPKSEEEITEFVQEHPDVAAVFETMISKKLSKQEEEVNEKFKQIEEDKRKNAEERAAIKLREAHPDLESLQESDDFHSWVAEQPKVIQDALYDNNEDWKSASRVIDLYKAEHDLPKKKASKTREDVKGAASSIKASSKSADTVKTADKVIKESDVQRMTVEQYQENEDVIAKAMREGRFDYDISGAAR
jgi:hypothetical protein